MKRNQGFSVIELMFGIAVISVTIVMVCILYTYMLKVSAKGLNLSIGTSVAEKKLNELAFQKTADLRTELIRAQTNGLRKAGNEIIGNTFYYYIIEVVPVSAESKLLQADIVVFWWVNNSSGEGSGNNFENELKAETEKTLNSASINGFLTDNKDRISRGASGLLYTRLTRFLMVPND